MRDRRRWTILAVGTFAQAATCCFLYGIPMLRARAARGRAVAVRGEPAGVGADRRPAADADRVGRGGRPVRRAGGDRQRGRRGGRAAVSSPPRCRAPVRWARAARRSPARAAASVNAASGRVVMGWFPAHERGLAMGTRQTAQPLGVALAALGLPPLARGARRARRAALPGGAVRASPRCSSSSSSPTRRGRRGQPDAPPARSPYRGSSRRSPACTWRARCSSCRSSRCATFTLGLPRRPAALGRRRRRPGDVRLPGRRRGRAGSRPASGPTGCGSRLRPMRQLAVASAALMLLIALGAAAGCGSSSPASRRRRW